MRSQFGSSTSIDKAERARLLLVASLLFVVVLGCLGVVFLYTGSSKATVIKSEVEPEIPQVKMEEVLVPVKPIDSGTLLDPAMFRTESRPAAGLSSKSVRSFEQIRGSFARAFIAPDQPLHSDYVTSSRPTNALTIKIPDGYRAVTISVDARSSVEGWARPGAKVDVVWASQIRGQPAVTIIVNNAQVISAERQVESTTGSNAKQGGPVPNTVTLLVTAQDAAKIQLAAITGTLTLSLRGDNDPGKADTSLAGSLTVNDLYPRGSTEDAPAITGPRIRMKNDRGEIEEFILNDGKLKPVM